MYAEISIFSFFKFFLLKSIKIKKPSLRLSFFWSKKIPYKSALKNHLKYRLKTSNGVKKWLIFYQLSTNKHQSMKKN